MKAYRLAFFTRIAIATTIAMLLAACGTDTIEWKEEVLLHDGRMIVVERKAKADSSGFPDANRGRFLEFELRWWASTPAQPAWSVEPSA